MCSEQRRPLDAASWERRYADDELPWDNGTPEVHLGRVITTHDISPAKSLEIGCGTGTNSTWPAKRGFEPTGMDISSTAISRAEAKAVSAGVRCRFLVGDFLVDEVPGGPFNFAYDRGCIHSFDDAADRARFAERIASLLEIGGIWHSLIGSTDGPPRDIGPPRRSAVDIASAVEPYFRDPRIGCDNLPSGRTPPGRGLGAGGQATGFLSFLISTTA